jgi:3-keto-disaccharide hydrolase
MKHVIPMLAAAFLFLGNATADEPPAEKWRPLFDGKSLTGWNVTKFGGEGDVEVKDGAIVLHSGNDLTGVTFAGKDLPKMDYELLVEAKRVKGNDFFATVTFPVGDSHCSLVTGGWAGSVVGISSLDGHDASENDTTTLVTFKDDQWYKFRVCVTKDRIRAWIDDKNVVDVDTKDKKISTRSESELSRPFGVASWQTTGAIRDIRIRELPK